MQLSVDEFVAETLDDYNSPTTSQFVNRINDCRQTVANLEEVRSSTDERSVCAVMGLTVPTGDQIRVLGSVLLFSPRKSS